MTAISDLLERIEKATGPDREIGIDLLVALDPFYGKADTRTDSMSAMIMLNADPTASIDAALALVERKLPGFDYILEHTNGGLTISCLLGTADLDKRAFADTAPLAILTTLLRALESETPA